MYKKYEVAIGPVTRHVLHSYRSGRHVKLNFDTKSRALRYDGWMVTRLTQPWTSVVFV